MGKLDVLFNYQTVELEKEAYERKIVSTPARKKLKKLHTFLKEQQATIARIQDEIAQRTAAVEKLNEQIARLEKDTELERSEYEQMLKDEECTAAEMTECRENHEKLQREANRLRRELEGILGWLENAVEEYKDTRKKAGAAKKEYDEVRAICDEEFKQAEGGRKEYEEKLQHAAEGVDPALLERYNRVKRNHRVPMAKVENNQCSGCNMALPTVVVKRVASSDSIVECDNCGRILYVDNK